MVLRALSSFETLYLARVSSRLSEAVGQAFQGGSRSPPGFTEGTNITRAIANELDSAKFDPLLVRSVARSVQSTLDLLHSRLDGMVSRDRSAINLAGPNATLQLADNASLASCAYSCWARLQKLEEEYPEAVYNILRANIQVQSINDFMLSAY